MSLSPDILRCIFQLFDAEYNSKQVRESRSNLFRCALVCKQFLNPALDALWDSMVSLVPLVQLLPSVKKINGAYVLCEPVRDDHWGRFDAYARRVKKLYFLDEQKKSYVAHTTYIQLASLRKLPLLPALRQLYCPKVNPEILSDALLLLSPAMNRAELGGISYHSNHIIGPFMNFLASIVPNIRHLVLQGQLTGTTSSLSQLRYLNSLVLEGVIDLELFPQLGTLPYLESLTVDLRYSTMMAAGAHLGFKQLRCLSIIGSISLITSIFEMMECEAMEQISIFIQKSANHSSPRAVEEYRNQWKMCLSVMYEKWPSSLSSISVTQDEMGWEQMWSDVCSQLSRWPKLETLRFYGRAQASNELVQQIALVCPHIKQLELQFLGAVRPDILALRTLAELCPKLVFLCVTLMFMPDSLLLGNEPCVLSHGLRELSIFNPKEARTGNVHTISHVARYIDCLFPTLSTISVAGTVTKDWLDVQLMVRMYQSIRQCDRDRRRNRT